MSDDEYEPPKLLVPDAASGSTVSVPAGVHSPSNLIVPSAALDASKVPNGSKTDQKNLTEPAMAKSQTKSENNYSQYHFKIHPAAAILSTALSPNGSILCCGTSTGMLHMIEFEEATRATSNRESAPEKTAHSQQRGRFVVPTRTLTPFPHANQATVGGTMSFQAIVDMSWACDGSYFVACQDGDFATLISSTGKTNESCIRGERVFSDVVKCSGHKAPITSIRHAPEDPRLFLTGSIDSSARVWDASSVTRRCTFAVKHGSGTVTDNPQILDVCFAPLGGPGDASHFLTAGSNGVVMLWDRRAAFRAGNCAASFTVNPSPVGGIAFLSKGSPLLATRSHDEHVRLFDFRVASAPPLSATPLAQQGKVDRIFSPHFSSTSSDKPTKNISFFRDRTPLIGSPFAHHKLFATTAVAGHPGNKGGRVVELDTQQHNNSGGPTITGSLLVSAEAHANCLCSGLTTPMVFAGANDGTVLGVWSRSESSDLPPTHFLAWVQARSMIGKKRERNDRPGIPESEIEHF